MPPPDPPRDPLETLQLEPEDLERLRDLSSPSEGSPRAPQLSIPFELTREVKEPGARPSEPRAPQPSLPFELNRASAVPVLRASSVPPPKRSRLGTVLAVVLAFTVGGALALYVLSRLGFLGVSLPWP